uniref:(northern house mosquito) hypothetical protein n=1 Tax=Culex pipiens TaxID=7175 RepID=A0A8D8GDH9_CULPI
MKISTCIFSLYQIYKVYSMVWFFVFSLNTANTGFTSIEGPEHDVVKSTGIVQVVSQVKVLDLAILKQPKQNHRQEFRFVKLTHGGCSRSFDEGVFEIIIEDGLDCLLLLVIQMRTQLKGRLVICVLCFIVGSLGQKKSNNVCIADGDSSM